MNEPALHETPHRLRLALPPDAVPEACEARVRALDGVRGTRLNRRLACLVVAHDGREGLREAVLAALQDAPGAGLARPPTHPPPGAAALHLARLAPLALAAAVPWLSGPWRSGAAAAAVALRLAAQPQRLRERPLAVVLEGGGQLALAFSGQAPVVATSVALRWLAETLSQRFVAQSEALLTQLLPVPAQRYLVLRVGAAEAAWCAPRELRMGDCLRLEAGDVVPVDACVLHGEARLAPVLPGSAAHPVGAGDAVAAGERLQRGALELRAEADADHSRLARLQHQLRHLLAARPVSATARGLGAGPGGA